jgi:hypothetical protein
MQPMHYVPRHECATCVAPTPPDHHPFRAFTVKLPALLGQTFEQRAWYTV